MNIHLSIYPSKIYQQIGVPTLCKVLQSKQKHSPSSKVQLRKQNQYTLKKLNRLYIYIYTHFIYIHIHTHICVYLYIPDTHTHLIHSYVPHNDVLVNNRPHLQRGPPKIMMETKNSYCLVTSQHRNFVTEHVTPCLRCCTGSGTGAQLTQFQNGQHHPGVTTAQPRSHRVMCFSQSLSSAGECVCVSYIYVSGTL